jgi:broad specificity phosphatase PhoE
VKELPEYKEMKFSEELLDASITKEGEIECEKLKEALAGEEFDIVVVSPLRRALETCMLSIGEKNAKVFVEPLASEKMTSACDIGSKLKQSKALFQHYDFSFVGGR